MELVGLFQENESAPLAKRKSNAQLEGFARKLADLAATCKARFWIGRYWDELSRSEHTPLVAVRLQHVVNPDLSPAAHGEFVDPDDWPSAIRAMLRDGAHLEYDLLKAEFVRVSNEWADLVRAKGFEDLNAMRNDSALQVAWIRRPDFIADWLISANLKFSEDGWRKALTRFPDRLAQARWARLVAWYALQRSLQPNRTTKSVENSFDDAHYAFLASYTKCLATEDVGLIEAVEAVFEGVRIWRPRQEGWSQHPFNRK